MRKWEVFGVREWQEVFFIKPMEIMKSFFFIKPIEIIKDYIVGLCSVT